MAATATPAFPQGYTPVDPNDQPQGSTPAIPPGFVPIDPNDQPMPTDQQPQSTDNTPPPPAGYTPITDPSDLDAVKLRGYENAAVGGINSGIAHLLGLPVDAANLLGTVVSKNGLPWVLNQLGFKDAADYVQKNSLGHAYLGSSQSIEDGMKKLGIGYEPTNGTEATIKNAVSGTTTGALLGLLTGGLGELAEAGTPSAIRAASGVPDQAFLGEGTANAVPTVSKMTTSAVNQGIAGGGGALGAQGAEAANKANRAAGGWSLPDPVAEFLGSLIGAGGLSGVANRSFLYDKPDIVNDYQAAGVSPHFPSDVGSPNSFFSKVLPERFGAKDLSQRNAEATQNQLRDYAHNALGLDNDGATLQQQGDLLQTKAANSVEALRQETSDAFADVRKTIDPSTPVDITDTRNAVGDLVNKANDPAVKKIVQAPAFQQYAPLLQKQTLSWSDVDVLRQAVGQALQGAEGTDYGLLSQLYKGVMNDMRRAASGNPEWLEAYNRAADIATENNDKIRGVLQTIDNRASPETLPAWLTQQTRQGSTRLDQVFNTPGFTPQDQATFGRWLLGNAGMNNGQFDLDRLMNYWRAASPEAKEALTADPDFRSAMLRTQRLYDATAGSRKLLQPEEGITAHGLLSAAEPLVASAGATIEGLLEGHHSALAGFAYPAFFHAAGKIGQIPQVASRLGSPVAGNMITDAQKLLGAGVGVTPFPDVYHPPAHTAEIDTEPRDAQWLGTADKPTAVAYVNQRLGPQVAMQLANTDANGYGAALFQLLSNPHTRAALFANGEDEDAIPTITVTPQG